MQGPSGVQLAAAAIPWPEAAYTAVFTIIRYFSFRSSCAASKFLKLPVASSSRLYPYSPLSKMARMATKSASLTSWRVFQDET